MKSAAVGLVTPSGQRRMEKIVPTEIFTSMLEDPSSGSKVIRYLLITFDPLDGSSNIDVNISVGTIFSILRCPEGVENPTAADFLQPGTTQVCAGYALYGPATMLVITSGHGVNGFTLDGDCLLY